MEAIYAERDLAEILKYGVVFTFTMNSMQHLIQCVKARVKKSSGPGRITGL